MTPAPERPVASVVIAVFDGTATLPAQLAALAAQEDAPPFEVLVMDNNSTDDLAGTIAPFLGEKVRILPARAHQGQCYARNLGALLARGEHVLFCDQDDVVAPTWVRALTDELDAASVLATGPMELARLNAEEVWRPDPDEDAPSLLRPYPVQGYLPFVYGSNLGMRREDFIALGGFDNSYRGGDEDTDISWRAQEAGHPIAVSEGAVVHYRLRSGARALFRQHRGYARTRTITVLRTQGTRPLRGMSLKWTLGHLALAPRDWLRVRGTHAGRLEWARRTGALVGNLEGQLRYRGGRTPEPELIDRARAESQELRAAAPRSVDAPDAQG